MSHLTTTNEVIDALGGLAIVAEITGRKTGAAWNWQKFETFPADTFLAMTTALAERGHDAPPSLWRQVEPRPADTKQVAA